MGVLAWIIGVVFVLPLLAGGVGVLLLGLSSADGLSIIVGAACVFAGYQLWQWVQARS